MKLCLSSCEKVAENGSFGRLVSAPFLPKETVSFFERARRETCGRRRKAQEAVSEVVGMIMVKCIGGATRLCGCGPVPNWK